MMGLVRKVLVGAAGLKGRAAPLALLAGQAAGRVALTVRTRRGSVLVLILGAVAMLAVVTVAYVTVGQADRRTGSVVTGRDKVREAIDSIVTYISRDVIGADVMATSVDGQDAQLPNPIDPTQPGPVLVRESHDAPSVDPALQTSFPNGTPVAPELRFNPVGTYQSVWQTSPTDPRFPSDPWLSSAEPVWLQSLSATVNPPADEIYRYRDDWLVISNLGPSGNPVNLYNLRNNFDVRPGFGQNPLNPPAGQARMSDRLSLPPINASAAPNLTTWYGKVLGNGDVVFPFYWTAHQDSAFRAAREFRAGVGPETAEYLPYQWADADGDGMFDARWFELVDVSDGRNPQSILPRDDRFRWIIAPRIIDLSGLLNVNTALDARSRPLPSSPAGVTPGDMDLRRVLRMEDPYRQWAPPTGQSLGYMGLEQPATGTGNYSNPGYDALTALQIGDWANYALRVAVKEGTIPYPGAALDNGAPGSPFTIQLPFSASQRSAYFRGTGGQQLGGSFAPSGGQNLVSTGALFGLPDLLELLTYWGVNDPARVSTLEEVMGGRFDGTNGGSPGTAGYSPLRDNRDLSVERGKHDNDGPAGAGNGIPDEDAVLLAAFDVRRLLTTYSAARLLRSSILLPFVGGLPDFRQQLDPAGDQKVDAVAALQRASKTTYAQRDAGLLFAGYAEALMPHSWRTGFWNAASNGPLKTMSYGNDPVLALWCAAHMTANAIDMYDRNGTTPQADKHEVSAFTLAVSGTSTDLDTLDNTPNLYPYWKSRVAGRDRPGTLDLDGALGLRQTNSTPTTYPSRMARQGDLAASTPIAMNVYGIEAQPFITQVASFIIYADTPVSGGGDEEWAGLGGPPPLPPPPAQPATIQGAVDQTNPDMICQVLAFQITNPFDHRVGLTNSDASLTTVPGDFSEYYLEFGGNYFKLTEVDESGGNAQPIVLDRRDHGVSQRDNTRIVYVLNDTLINIQERFQNASLQNLAVIPQDAVKQIIERQLNTVFQPGGALGSQTDVKPILITRMDPTTGAAVVGQFTDIIPGTVQSKTAKLWRRIETPGVNLVDRKADDMLADRLRDPTPGTRAFLDRRLDSTQNQITDLLVTAQCASVAGSPDPNSGNTGYSFCIAASIKRPDDNPAQAGQIPRGVLPAYCLEAQPGALAPNLQNFREPPSTLGPPGPLRKCHFSDPPGSTCTGTETLIGGGEFLVAPVANPGQGLLEKLGAVTAQPLVKTIGVWPEEKNDNQHILGTNTHSALYQSLYPEIHLNNARFETTTGGKTVSTLRAGDMLLPMCIGPTYIPAAAGNPSQGWLTLGEAMAMALGYADVDPALVPEFAFLENLGNDVTNAPKTDRGNMALHRFIPFEDLDSSGTFTQTGTPPDQARAPHVPLAGTVLDVFRTTDPDLSSLERGVQGLVNLSTAPSRVLKAFPMACPPLGGAAEWWGTTPPPGITFGTLPNPTNGDDYGATIEAYRDRLEVPAVDGEFGTFQESPTQIGFQDDATQWDGRLTTTQILGLREAPGIASLGELLCATDPVTTGTPRVPPGNQIDRLGRDQANSGAPGVNTTLYRPTLTTQPPFSQPLPNPNAINEIQDEYAEKLSVASAIAGAATVRSDTFACWVLIHGYQRSDCEGLSDQTGRADPMVPTISKRYLLVIDRSNVTRLGDKPRILIMQELPF